MRSWIAIAVLAGCGAPKPAPEAALVPAPVAVAAAPSGAACDATSIQPMLDANAALAKTWGDGLTTLPRELALVPAGAGLEPLPPGEPIFYDDGHGGAQWIGDRRGAPVVVVAIGADVSWGEVVDTAHGLGVQHQLRFAFAIDPGAARLADNPLRASLDVNGAHAMGADFQRRCPAVAALFMPHDDLLAYIARAAGPALASCKCAVAPAEVGQLYDALMVPRYVAVRTIAVDRKGLVVSARRLSTFAQVAPKIMAVAPGTALAFVAE